MKAIREDLMDGNSTEHNQRPAHYQKAIGALNETRMLMMPGVKYYRWLRKIL